MSNTSAELMELFSSIQGEGLLVGVRQVFLRFHSCNLHCDYCDTVQPIRPEHCLIEGTPGRRDFFPVANPVSLERVLALLDRWQGGWPAIHHSLSLTGGEPLLHHEALAEWLPALKERLPIYLETNGILHQALGVLVDAIDHISMDIKLPSSSGYTELWHSHRDFLKVAARSNVFVKVVIAAGTEDWEILKTCDLIAEVDRTIPLLLQPVTLPGGRVGVTPLKMLELQELASARLAQVRVVPQTHKFLGLL